ncbi:MAG: cytochrome c oxidase subunit 3 [Vicinamibacterales bacterium]
MFTGDVQEQFQDLEQQTHAAELGMWVFLASEVLFFSGLFGLFAAYRFEYGDLFREAARHTDLALGTANTFILLTSSLLVALCVHGIGAGWRIRSVQMLLAGTATLGLLFLGLKLLEYVHHFREGIYPGAYYAYAELPDRGARVFFTLYYAMTGIHAVHVAIGIALMIWMLLLTRNQRLDAAYHTPLELAGIYWHFVDIVWVFLWPMFYLMRG